MNEPLHLVAILLIKNRSVVVALLESYQEDNQLAITYRAQRSAQELSSPSAAAAAAVSASARAAGSIAVGVANLLASGHFEGSTLFLNDAEVPRMVYAELRLRPR